jgi:hypothetical protein
MMHAESDRSRSNGRKGSRKRSLIPVFLVILIAPAWGADTKDGRAFLSMRAQGQHSEVSLSW